MAGSTVKLSITLPRELAEKLRARSGPGEVSAYVAAAVQRQIEMDNLHELIAAAEAEHGPITEQEIEATRVAEREARRQMEARRQQGKASSTAA